MHDIIIGTRGSQLSLKQTSIVQQQIQSLLPESTISVKIIKTTGDSNMNPVPLDSIGKGWFTKELDKELLKGNIDIAVHSLKDLPEILTSGLMIAVIPDREDAREALITNTNLSLQTLPKGAVIGTDSSRRKAQILFQRPDLIVKSVRGNVNRRLAKLDAGEYDALFLAVAGLKRLGLEKRITQYFDPTDFIPSPGQGALAVVINQQNTKLKTILKKLNHLPSVTAVKAERAFSKEAGGGCKMPIGAYALCEGDTLTLYGVIGSLDGKHLEKDMIKGDARKPITLGKTLARELLHTCKPWYKIQTA